MLYLQKVNQIFFGNKVKNLSIIYVLKLKLIIL
jgi:hypothetical protein